MSIDERESVNGDIPSAERVHGGDVRLGGDAEVRAGRVSLGVQAHYEHVRRGRKMEMGRGKGNGRTSLQISDA